MLEIHGRSKWLIVIQLNCFFTKILCVQKALTFIMVSISFSRPFLQSVWCCLLLLREWALGVLPGGRVSPGQAALWLEQRLSGLSDDGSLPAVHPLQGGAALYQRAPAAGQSVSLQAVIFFLLNPNSTTQSAGETLIENGRMDRKAQVNTLYIVQFASGHIIILLFAEKIIVLFFFFKLQSHLLS